MVYTVLLLLLLLVVGGVGVAANPAPHFGVVGLVLGAGASCGVLIGLGSSFIGLVLFLIYLGGMLVVFAYSIAAAADLHPQTWRDYSVFVYVMGYSFVILLVGWAVFGGCFSHVDVGGLGGGLFCLHEDFVGVSLMFGVGGGLLLLCGWGLFLTLFVVFELVRGGVRGGLCMGV